ncbi:hypothetical protein AB6A40_009567 [Gnathostoma spinigerum]|uniref:Anti-proliferative protein domain-containing protein n=1 Tax=Gnathostoma spinigerum TaxID=75299 RepID=A0ABD6F059_9BILA
MYTEIKELVNFLALFLHERLPRRKVCLFSEQLANFLLLKYQEKWVISDPKMYEDDRILRIKAKGVTDNLIEVSATSTGVDLRELIGYITSSLVIYCNPGEVFYRVEEGSIAVPIWMGSVDEDDHYKPNPVVPLAIGSGGSNMGAAGRPHLPVPVAGRCDSSGNLRATDRTVPLSLVKENSELPLPVNGDRTLGTVIHFVGSMKNDFCFSVLW